MKKIVAWTIILLVIAGPSARPGVAAEKCTKTLPKVFEDVSKSVVLITAISLNPFSLTERFSPSIGSGFIISKDGLILTNAHVVFGRHAVSVTLDDGQNITADVVGADPALDLALLKIDASGRNLPTLPLDDGPIPKVGEEVIAVGNPLGLGQTLTRGVISGVNRVLPTSPMSIKTPMIQTDASINPGNSGGPLVNRCGVAVGINTAALIGAENIGFAVPATIIRQVLPQLIQHGRVIRPWLGINGRLIDRGEFQRFFNIDVRNGLLVEVIEPGSPAESIGLKGGVLPVKIAGDELLLGGDIITQVNGTSIAAPKAFRSIAQSIKIGDVLELTVFREGRIETVSLTVAERPILPWDLPWEECRSNAAWGQ